VAVYQTRPPIPQDCLPNLAALVKRCWHASSASRPSFQEIEANFMPVIIVEAAIQDEIGRQIWKAHFLGKDHVPWENFVAVFYTSLRLHLDVPTEEPLSDIPLGPTATDYQIRVATMNRLEDYASISPEAHERAVGEVKRRRGHGFYNSLKKLLVERVHDKEVVTLERFGLVLGLFGPLSQQYPLGMFERIATILPQPWFYGEIDKDAAFNLLSTKRPGTFLIRFSTNPEFVGFVLSFVDPRRTVVHIRVKHNAGQPRPFVLAGEHNSFATLDELILKNRDLLVEPCLSTGTPYTLISLYKVHLLKGGMLVEVTLPQYNPIIKMKK